MERCGSALSTQAVGPKLAWLYDNEPDIAAKARKLFMPSSWLAYQLTGEYILTTTRRASAPPCTTQRLTAGTSRSRPE